MPNSPIKQVCFVVKKIYEGFVTEYDKFCLTKKDHKNRPQVF